MLIPRNGSLGTLLLRDPISGNLASVGSKAIRSHGVRGVIVIVIHDGVNKDILVVQDREHTVGRNGDPVIPFESQRLRSDEHDIRAFVSAFHLIFAFTQAGLVIMGRFIRRRLFSPIRPRRKEETGCLIGPRRHVSSANHALPIRDGEIEQTPRISRLFDRIRQSPNKPIDPLDGQQHRVPQHRVPEPMSLFPGIIRIDAGSLQRIEEQGERPFGIRRPLHALEPPVGDVRHQFPLNSGFPPADPAVVHPHQRPATERMAIAIAQRAFGAGPHVREDQRGHGFGRQPFEVATVPRGDGRGEDAWFRTEIDGVVTHDDAGFRE